MGTRGYIVVKLNRKYHRAYNHWDSYPSALGSQLVCMLLANAPEPTVEYLDYILSGRSEIIITTDETDIENDVFIEWVYIIDLDEMTFKIAGGYYEPVYPLSELSGNWLEEFDQENNRLANLNRK